ncbi:chaperonin 10-like protein [Suillus lakei]|nr:chaperonin 10-like protein [Suillus lakei]
MSSQQKALFLPKNIPSPSSTGQLLVKIHSAALNPVDYKIQDTGMFATHHPVILGVDIAGIVEEPGGDVENFRKGDNVLAHGNFSIIDQGAFQQYALTVATFTAKVSLERVPTVPLGLDTAVAGLYGKYMGAGITPPWVISVSDHEPKKPIVILGGSSCVAAIQLARLSGFYPVITTASPSNKDLVRDYGATHFFDRHLSQKTQSVGWGLLAQNGILVSTLPALVKEDEGKGRKAVSTLGSPYLPHNQELHSSSWAMVEKWLLEGTIQPNNHEILPNGLEGIVRGLERMRMQQVSGTKLVAHPQETQ